VGDFTAWIAAGAVLMDLLAGWAHLRSLLRPQGSGEEGGVVPLTVGGGALHLVLLFAVMWAQGAGVMLTIAGGVVGGGVGLMAVYGLLGWRFGLRSLGSLVMPLVALSALPPLLQVPLHSGAADSVLVVVHVVAALLGTFAFMLALLLAVLYLVQSRQLKRKRFHPWLRRLPSLEQLDALALRLVVAGFAAYSFSIILGMFRAWQQVSLHMDPRSAMSALTWALYALMLQGRVTAGWRGVKAAKLTVAGALCAITVVMFYFLRP
jgi:ABC-type uncharacterized transport system permease subunit